MSSLSVASSSLSRTSIQPWVIAVDTDTDPAFSFVSEGSLVVMVADRSSQLFQNFAIAVSMRDGALLGQSAPALARKALQTAAMGQESPSALLEIGYLGRTVATITMAEGAEMALTELPYSGGPLDTSAFTAEAVCRNEAMLEAVILLREPELSGIEKTVNQMMARPVEGIWFGGVIYNAIRALAHEAKHHVDALAQHAGEYADDARTAAEVVAEATGPDAEVATDAAIADAGGLLADTEPRAQTIAVLSSEPTAEELIGHRARMLAKICK